MYIKIDEDLYKKIQSITMTDYNLEGGMLPVDSIEPMLEDLLCEIHNQEERYEDLEQDLRENYEPIPASKLYGIDERDFY